MFTFKHLSRLSALFIALFVSFTAYAAEMQVYTVTNTNSSGTGSFQDAINTVNTKGGSWTIKFEIPGDEEKIIKLKDVVFENFEDLAIISQKDVYFQTGYYDGYYQFYNGKSISLVNFNIKDKTVSWEVIRIGAGFKKISIEESSFEGGDIHLLKGEKSSYLELVDKCKFISSGISGTLKLGTIKNSNFEQSGIMLGSHGNSYDSYNEEEIISDYISINTIDNCVFEESTIECRYNKILKSGEKIESGDIPIKKIENCVFTGYHTKINYGDIELLNNCDFSGPYKAISNSSLKEVKKCRFKCSECALYDVEAGTISECEFTPSSDLVSTLYLKKVDLIKGCTFALNQSEWIPAVNRRMVIWGNLSGGTITGNTFKGVANSGCNIIYSYGSIPGIYSNNVVDCSNNFGKTFSSTYPIDAPIIEKVFIKEGYYNIIGTANKNSNVEIFLSNKYRGNALKSLTSVTVDDDGMFIATIPISEIEADEARFNATSTIGNQTSDLCETKGITVLKDVYVKTSGSGIGDGSNWKNAMSFADFCTQIAEAQNGTTFHFAAGEYGRNGYTNNSLRLNSSVSIIGGYPETNDDVDKVKSDPVNNHTVFKVLPGSDGYSTKTQHEFFFGNTDNANIEFHNIDFDHASIRLGSQNIVVDSCNFYDSNWSVNIIWSENARISNSFFAKNSSEIHGESSRDYNVFMHAVTKGVIENCAFDAQPFTSTIWIDTARVDVINNTFLLRERTFSDWEKERGYRFYLYFGGDAKRTLFKNNTVVTVSTSGQMKKLNDDGFIFFKSANIYSNLFAVGNPDIFNTNKIPNVTSYNSTSSKYMVGNLLGHENNTQNLTGIDKSVNYLDELESILDGNKEGSAFFPVLKNNGGYTPTIKLINDKLSEGTSIRVNKSSTYTATTDQRGVVRTNKTCVGAYEFECSKGEFAVNKASIKVAKPYCYSQTGNGTVRLKIGNWLDGCKAYFYKGEEELWSVDALDSPNNNYNLKIADNAVEELYNGARYVDSVDFYYSGLSGGSYSFVLEDLCGNKTTTPITIDPIEKPSFVVSKSSKTELSCYNSTDGSIEITLVGGELELCGKASSYDIKGLEFTEKNRTVKATGLAPGSYRFVYGTTAKMCSDNADTTIVITAPDTVKAKCDFKDAYCAEIGGSATFYANGGIGNYSVTISDISGNVFKKESFAGENTVTVGGMKLMTTYSAVVEDGYGCQAKELGGIRFWTKTIPELNTLLTASNETCYEENNGRVKFTYSGNNDKDELVVSAIGSDGKPHNAYFSEVKGSALIEDLAPGEYTVKLDFGAEGCNTPGDYARTIGTVTIKPFEKILVDASSLVMTSPTCTNPANGRADIEIKNWPKGGMVTVYSNGNGMWGTQDDPTVGEYTGAAPGQFYYENEEKKKAHTAHVKIPNINGKTYTVEVKDKCGNVNDTYDFDFGELSKPMVLFREDNSHIELDCAGSTDGVIFFNVGGGSTPNLKAYVNDEEVMVGKGNCVKEGLPAGSYVIAYKSTIEGCKDAASETIEITEPTQIEIHKLSSAPVVCEAMGTTAYASVGGGTPDYTYRWTDAEGNLLGTGDKVEHLSVGEDYKLVVTDSKLCKDSATFNVELWNSGSLDGIVIEKVEHNDQKCYGVDNGSIKVQFSGNTSNDPLKLAAIGSHGETKFATTSEEAGLIEINDLAPATYNVVLSYNIEGCDVSTASLSVAEEITVEALEEPKFLEDNYAVTHNQCENIGKGRMHLEMMGWAPDVYTWTIKRAGQTDAELKKHTHCGDKLPNGATAFDLWTLPEGENVFTMWDACGYKYTKTANIKADYLAPLTIDTVNSKAYSCEGRTDGRFTFVAWPWDIEDSAAVLKDGNIGLKDFKPEVKDGKAYFELKGQGAGVYTLVTTDLCGREESKENNFTDFSTKNGMLTIKAEIDEEAEECEIGKRVIKATATGGTAPYIFSIEKNGTAVETSEAIDATSYGSELLGEGKYTVSVTDKTDCKAVYGEDLTIKSEKLNVKLGTLANIEQTCYGKDNAGVSVSYSGFDTEVAKLRLLVTEKTASATKKTYEAYADANEGTLAYTELPTGAYEVKVQLLGINGCEMNNGVLLEKEVEFKPLEEPRFLEDNYFSEDNKCENIGKGRMHLEMMGWAPDVYTWTIKRAGQTDAELKKHTHCGDKLPNGATAFDLWTLPEGENVFTMWDACGYKYTKTADIKADYVAPLTIDTVNSKAYSCEGRTDGRFTFVAWPWDIEDSAAVLKDGNIGLKDFKPEVKDGKAYFELKGQGAGVYTLVTTDLCGREESKENNFTDFSAKNGRLTVGVDFDAEAAKCDAEKRIFKVTATGGTAPYIYTITNNGTLVETTEATENTLYVSQIHADGQYKVMVKDETECIASQDVKVKIMDQKSLNKISVAIKSVTGQQCYGENNGSITASFSGNSDNLPLRLIATSTDGFERSSDASEEKGTFEIDGLAPGTYTLNLGYVEDGCEEASAYKVEAGNATITAIAGPFKIDTKSLEFNNPSCFKMKATGKPNGYGQFNISNWYEKSYSIKAYIDGKETALSRTMQYEEEGTTATMEYKNLNGGKYKIVANDVCGNSDEIAFNLDSIFEPKFTLKSEQEKLYCNREAVNFERNAHVGLIFNGGDKETGRLKLVYPEGEPVYKSHDALGYVHFSAAEKAGAELLEDKTSKIERDVFYYMDSLSYGKYTLKYMSTVEGCSDYAEYVFQTKEPAPIRSLIATAPITCKYTETAEFSVIPNGEYYKPKYVAVGDAENLGEKMLNNLNGDTEYWADGAFKGVKTIAIATKNSDGELNYEDAYSKLRETIKKEGGEPRSFPLTDFWQPLKKIGASMYGDTVREYWIGFANMPGQVYYLVTTDANDCRFVEEINLTASPKAPLKIDNLEYLAEKEADAACDAKTHRVKLAISGGWRGGYVVGIRDVNKMEEEDEEEVIKEIEEGAEDKDYGGAATSLTYQPGDTLTYNADSTAASYKSAILQPGTYMVTVVDRKGCIDTAEQIVEVKSHIDVKAEVGINLCDQNAGNFFYPEATFNKPYNGGSIVAYAIRYENTNVGDSIYVNEMKEENGRKVLENVPSGIIGLFAYDENGCSGYDTFFVKKKEITLLHFLALDQQKTRCYGSDDGEISFNLSGGYWPYTRFSLQKKDENENVLIDEEKNSTKAVQWFVEKKDSIFTTNEGKIDTSVTSSHVPSGKDFAFNVNVGDTFKLSDKFVYGGLLAGNYVMRVTDHEGCRDSLMFTIEQPDLIQFDLKTSPICPNDSARIFPTSVTGGYPPYTYAVAESKEQAESLIAEDFGTEDHVPIKVNKSGNNFFYVVRDTNDCRIIKDPSDVKTDTLKDVYQDALAARYHDLSDVLVVSDVTNLNNAKPKVDYDSCKVEVVILDPETHEPDPYSNFEALMMPKELYTYGVKPKEKEMDGDSLEIWDGIKIARPQDFIPADIAAGVQTKEDYAKNYASMVQPVKDRLQKIENSIKDLEKKQAKLAEEGKELSQQQKEELADLKESHKLCADTVHMKSRQLCTVDMIKGHFEKLEQDEPIKRQTFFKFVHDESTINVDSIDFIVRVTSYVGGCSYVMEKNYLSMYVDGRSDSLYGKTSGKEIISTALSENPVNQGTPTELHLKLGKPARELDLDISYYNVLGEKVKASETINEEVSKDSEGNYNYTVAVPTDDFGNSSLIIISITTKHERKVERLLINNIGE